MNLDLKKWISLLGLVVMTNSFAGVEKAPPAFSHNNSKAVFVDFKEVFYDIDFKMDERKIYVTSEISFDQFEEGFPIFDLKKTITSLKVNGQDCSSSTISDPDRVTNYLIANCLQEIGSHEMVIEHELSYQSYVTSYGIDMQFAMSDLNDRRYLEQYLPSNLEFDQFKVDMDISIGNMNQYHEMLANGDVESYDGGFKVSYPKEYTASSFYFHLVSSSLITKAETEYVSQFGKVIPITIYSKSYAYEVPKGKDKALKVLAELESDYGEFLHDKLIIMMTSPWSGGMEYSGATTTSLNALGHELCHSYFARGTMPASGDSGWIDEAIASWRDSKYSKKKTLGFSSSNMGNRSIYIRYTDRRAYSSGRDFIAHLDYLKNGEMKGALRSFFEKQSFNPYMNMDFILHLNNYFDDNFRPLFDQYIMSSKNIGNFEEQEILDFHYRSVDEFKMSI